MLRPRRRLRFPRCAQGCAALMLLMLTAMLNMVDRFVVHILAEPIKREFGLADWQLGVVTGVAFALFYGVCGLPIARISEHRNRPFIIAVSMAVWSVFTAACAGAQSFVQLALLRMGVSIGEAGCVPPAMSLIMDYAPIEKRASSLAWFQLGIPLGSLVGLGLGGVLADAYGWRIAFLWCGLPGVALAVLVAWVLPEPRRVKAGLPTANCAAQPSFGETMHVLRSKRSYWLLSVGSTVKSLVVFAQAPFMASYFLRCHEQQVATLAAGFHLGPAGFLGLSLGMIAGVGGMLGTWIGGQLADRGARRTRAAYAIVPAVAGAIAIPIQVATFLTDSMPVALTLIAINSVVGIVWQAPVYAGILGVVPPNMRATAVAIQLLLINLLGLGLGPLFVGVLSDLFAGLGHGSAEGLRLALLASNIASPIMVALFWAARRPLLEDSL